MTSHSSSRIISRGATFPPPLDGGRGDQEYSLFTRRMVWRLINQNANGDPSKDSARHLLSLWSDRRTEKLVYFYVIEKLRLAMDEVDPTHSIAPLLKLLIQQLSEHPPPNDLLTALDGALSLLITHLVSPELGRKSQDILKSALFLRQLANCRLYPHLRHEKTFENAMSQRRDKRTEITIDRNAVVTNLFDLVLKSSKVRHRIQRHLTLSICTVLGGHLERYPGEHNDAFQFFFVHDYHSLQDQFLVVSQEKKREEEKLYEEAGLPPITRADFHLFAYKHYREQSSLTLSKEEIELVVSTVVNPPEDDQHCRLVSSNILIKLLLDMFCIDRSSAPQLLISLLFEMLSSGSISTQVHAFNLLFNVSVHANMMEKMPYVGHEESLESSTSTLGDVEHENTTQSVSQAQHDLYAVLREMMLWLLHNKVESEAVWAAALNSLLYFITHNGRVDKERLLQCDPRIFPELLKRLKLSDDVRRKLIRMLITFLWKDNGLDVTMLHHACGIHFIINEYCHSRCMEVRENLFTMLFFYIVQTRIKSRTSSGGASASSRSDNRDRERSRSSGKDWYESSVGSDGGVGARDKSYRDLLQLMRLVEAPHYFVDLFKLGSFLSSAEGGKSVLSPLKEFFLHHDTRRLVSKKPDRRVLEDIFGAFVQLAKEYAELPEEFEGAISDMLGPIRDSSSTHSSSRSSSGADKVTRAIESAGSVLHGLLHSSMQVERRAGSAWMFRLVQQLLRIRVDHMCKSSNAEKPKEDKEAADATENIFTGPSLVLHNWVNGVMDDLVRSPNPQQRQLYIEMVNLSLLYLKTRITKENAATIVDLMIDVVNGDFGRLISVDDKPSLTENADGETHVGNLMQLTDIIFSLLIAPRAGTTMYKRSDASNHNLNVYSHFLAGTVGVAVPLLQKLDVHILKHLFLNLRGSSHKDALLSLLFLIMRKCDLDDVALRELGTIAFFKKMLLDSNPEVAYFAGKYLIEHLREREDNQYQAVFGHLLEIARQQNTDEVLSNYYLQVLAIMTMGDGTEKRTTRLRSSTHASLEGG